MARLIVDSRESVSGLAKMREGLSAKVVIKQLESADLVLAKGLGVKRIAASDLVLSLAHVEPRVPVLESAVMRLVPKAASNA
ncbi:hypothetical protein AB4Z46_28480 [Variovorax sp. M-6]|uniref:hypothetical protein n=1 Tax=Variovorax sp. M-6 TaxID=3233041 RepID=UPI003F94D299